MIGIHPERTRTFVIDPRRKQQNADRAQQLIALQGDALKLALSSPNQEAPQYLKARQVLRGLERGMDRNWGPERSESDKRDKAFLDHLPPSSPKAIEAFLFKDALDRLRDALGSTTKPLLLATIDGRDHFAAEPAPFDPSIEPGAWEPVTRELLTERLCADLVRAVADLHLVLFDPQESKPLAIDRAYYARERTKLIDVEARLWQMAAELGAPGDRIPYTSRIYLLAITRIPDIDKPPDAYSLCLRCGLVIFQKRRRSDTPPRCNACMKETPAQREWPLHAVEPYRRGIWLLHCQYPDCDMVFEGPRHRKLCPNHTSSRLPPKQRLAATKQPE
jgi:hypothetical protein